MLPTTKLPSAALHAMLLVCVGLGPVVGACEGWRATRAGFVAHRDARAPAETWTTARRRPSRRRDPIKTAVALSPNDDDLNDNDAIDPPVGDDPDGVPLFDTNERATFCGLEPRANVDLHDNKGLEFTGPVVSLLSIYVTLAFFLADDMPVVPSEVLAIIAAVGVTTTVATAVVAKAVLPTVP